MARRIEAATGIETRATILGHMQRGGNLTWVIVYASMMGALAVDLLVQGKSVELLDIVMENSWTSILTKHLQCRKMYPHICGKYVTLSHNYKNKNTILHRRPPSGGLRSGLKE